MYTYDPYDEILRTKNQGVGLDIAVGSGYASIWRVVQTERMANLDVLVTLKALTTFGVLPDIDDAMVPRQSLGAVRDAMDRASDSAYREIPTSVIDQCRNAANVVLSHWLVANGAADSVLKNDLGATLIKVQQDASRREAACFAGSLINRLHPRGKANEQASKGLRVPVEEDSLIAIQALGFILREVGWAK
ncbi:hypothetical protein [Variovorax davisae]|uniref:hypothetical protein n=1 Tax=Variovorax davisae TaxID=3053515 RepID=UPI002578CE85|nr:hypothetical protein [Variovorax sp. J22P271]